jgi:hypothetical protein
MHTLKWCALVLSLYIITNGQTLDNRLPTVLSFSGQQLKSTAATLAAKDTLLFPRYAATRTESITYWTNYMDTSYLTAGQSPSGKPETLITWVGLERFNYTLPAGTWWSVWEYDWTAGFFPGCLWYAYELTSDTAFLSPARAFTEGMYHARNLTNTHDIGFQIFCSYGNAYRLTQDAAYKEVILRAADRLALRYSTKVKSIRSWNWGSWEFPVIIDNMMNLEILIWGAANGGDPAWQTMAVQHAHTTRLHHIRADGSVYHVVDYNSTTGTVKDKENWQGYSENSAWSRGQAWAVHGFTTCFRETGDSLLLATAEKCADYYINNLPADNVPYWDFKAPNIPNEPKDASAAAVAASGLLELSSLEGDTARARRYFDAAEKTLLSLASSAYLAQGTVSPALLLHSTGNGKGGKEVDVSLIYADYYFLEALVRYQQYKPVPITQPTRAVKPLHHTGLTARVTPTRQLLLTCHLARPGQVQLQLYNLAGQVTRNPIQGYYPAGENKMEFPVPGRSGIFLVKGWLGPEPVLAKKVVY